MSKTRVHEDGNLIAMPRQARKVDLENPVVPIVCVDLNGVLDAYTGWKHAEHWDPPRPGVAEAIRRARVAGIRTVMLTGDQLNTGRAIARELGRRRRHSPLRIAVLEQRETVGEETSGRNSGVLHSGIHEHPSSLKIQFGLRKASLKSLTVTCS